ncbi:MAG: hypothetical protein ACOYXY_14975 [Thermodesulfobacteriota bacterium]
MSSYFFAMPEEQRGWFEPLVSETDVWFVVHWPEGGVRLGSPSDFDPLFLQFRVTGRRKVMLIDIGNRNLCPAPVWERSVQGEIIDLDSVGSQTIRYLPSVIHDNTSLTLGDVGIASKGWFQDRGIDHKPLAAWYRKIVKSIKKMRLPGITLMFRGFEEGPGAHEYKDIMVTPGAARWSFHGGSLKQWADEDFEFVIKDAEHIALEDPIAGFNPAKQGRARTERHGER